MAVHHGRRGPGHQARAAAGLVDDGPDTTPEAFVLGSVAAAPLSTLQESATVTVLGTNQPSAVSIVGGEYSVNGGAWTPTAGTVTPGDAVKVRRAASATVATATAATLTIGGVSDVFTVTTVENAEASALASRFATPADDARRGLIDDCIAALKTAGLWAKLDAFYMLAAHDAQAARCNWVQDAFNLTSVNSPAFTVDRGYTGDGASAYLDTGLETSTGTAQWQVLSSMCMGAYVATNPVSAEFYLGRAGAASLSQRTPNGSNWVARIGRSSDTTTTTAALTGTFAIRRMDGASVATYTNGAEVVSAGTAGTASSGSLVALRAGSSYGTARVAAIYWGSGAIDATEHQAIHNAITTHLTAIGAA